MKKTAVVSKLVMMLILTCFIGTLVQTNASASFFPDVAEDYWGYNDIKELYDRGVINGYEDGTFRPNDNVTRAEVAKMVTVLFNIEEPENARYGGKFADVLAGEYSQWYYDYVACMKNYMLGADSPRNDFSPPRAASRNDVAVTLANVLFNNGEIPPRFGNSNGEDRDFEYTLVCDANSAQIRQGLKDNFTDVGFGNWYDREDYIGRDTDLYIYLMAKNGVITGYPDKTFQKTNTITRAEMCAMLNRAFKVKNGETLPNNWKESAPFIQEGEQELSQEQLAAVEKYLNLEENNGFVAMSGVNVYSEPSEIDLWTVFTSYEFESIILEFGETYADGTEQADFLASDIDSEYRESSFVPKFKTSDLNDFLKKKTGLVLRDFQKSEHSVFDERNYIAKYDAYYLPGGDAWNPSSRKIEINEGKMNKEGLYVIKYTLPYEMENGFPDQFGVVTLKPSENEQYMFVSNIEL